MVQTAAATREAILQAVRARLEALPDTQLAAVADPASVGTRMAQVIPAAPGPGQYGRIIGPVYSTQALVALWDVTREAVSKKARGGRLLALKVEGANLFPLFQFHEDGEVRDDVMDVVGILRGPVDPFTIAQWLRTPQVDDPNGRTPLELLDAGRVEDVHAAARAAATRWAA